MCAHAAVCARACDDHMKRNVFQLPACLSLSSSTRLFSGHQRAQLKSPPSELVPVPLLGEGKKRLFFFLLINADLRSMSIWPLIGVQLPIKQEIAELNYF